jgi:hypothetical protein
LLNGISYLFEREDIPPEIIRNIMLYCLDCYATRGAPGTNGTSCAAMMYLSNWLDGFGETGHMSIQSQYMRGETVYIGMESRVNDAINRGGVAVVRLFDEVDHYVLLTGIQGDKLLMFDPYYDAGPHPDKNIIITLDHPFEYNRIVPFSYFNRESEESYALGKKSLREAVLLFNTRSKLTEETTIEYFI